MKPVDAYNLPDRALEVQHDGMGSDNRHWFRSGFWRREWISIQRRYYLDRIRHPRNLTWREWVAHARMLAMNLALITAVFAGMWWLADRFNPNLAPGIVGLAVGLMLRDWLYGKHRRHRPPVRRLANDATHGELLESGTAFNPKLSEP